MELLDEVLITYKRDGPREALKKFLTLLQQWYGVGQYTVLLPDSIFSTIKNLDDRDSVIDDYWVWHRDKKRGISNRISGLTTRYYALEGEYDDRQVVSGVLIAEAPDIQMPIQYISMASMLSILVIVEEKEISRDPITGLPCADSLLEAVNEREDACCVVMAWYPQVTEITKMHGWLAGNDMMRKYAQCHREKKLYMIDRGVFAIVMDGDITSNYDDIAEQYEQMQDNPNVLIAEVLNPGGWDSLYTMREELLEMKGLNIMYQRTKSDSTKDGCQDLFALMGLEIPEYQQIDTIKKG